MKPSVAGHPLLTEAKNTPSPIHLPPVTRETSPQILGQVQVTSQVKKTQAKERLFPTDPDNAESVSKFWKRLPLYEYVLEPMTSCPVGF